MLRRNRWQNIKDQQSVIRLIGSMLMLYILWKNSNSKTRTIFLGFLLNTWTRQFHFRIRIPIGLSIHNLKHKNKIIFHKTTQNNSKIDFLWIPTHVHSNPQRWLTHLLSRRSRSLLAIMTFLLLSRVSPRFALLGFLRVKEKRTKMFFYKTAQD